MPRVPTLLLPVLAAALWPMQAPAQEGPSFDCRYARTDTEAAICANPDLARLEMRMYGSYLGLVEAMGEGEARRIADRFLERRQACGGDEACIAERLLITMEAFQQRAAGGTDLAALAPAEEEPAPPAPASETPLAAAAPPPPRPEGLTAEPAPMIEEDLAALDPPPAPPIDEPVEPTAIEEEPTAPDLPLAAQAPLPPDLDPLLDEALDAAPPEATDLAAAEPPPSSGEIGEAIEGAELTSSDEAASFDTPVSWAFMDLPREERADLQARLQAAGLHEGPAEGNWDRATEEALDAFLASEEGAGFDPTTEPGAALALDFIRSDAFSEAPAAEPAADDPLAAAEW